MSTSIVAEPLNEKNYKHWRACMKSYLMSQDLWEVVEEEVENKAFDQKKNAAALHAILISCSPYAFALIDGASSARFAWDILKNRMNGLRGGYEGSTGAERDQVLDLFNAINSRNLCDIHRLLRRHPNLIKAKLFRDDETTALHLAVTSTELAVVNEVVGKMSNEDIKKKVGGMMNFSALDRAAFNGAIEIVDCLIGKNEKLLEDDPASTLLAACMGGHKDMMYHLYSRIIIINEFELNDYGPALILPYMVYCRWFDLAFDLIRRFGSRRPQIIIDALGTLTDGTETEVPLFLSATRLSLWQRWIYYCLPVKPPNCTCVNEFRLSVDEKKDVIKQEQSGALMILSKLFGITHTYNLKQAHVCAKKLLQLLSDTITSFKNEQIRDRDLDKVIFDAARLGITEVIVEIISRNPDFLWCTDDKGRNIFHIAILHRQGKVFSLIYGIGALKDRLVSSIDDNGRSLLHMAGESAPQRLVDRIQGPALLMQRELQWFQEVQSNIPWSFQRHKNNDGKTPYEVFDENHMELYKQGEKWMKDIARSSTVVGALIITIMFAGLSTVPGGNDQDTGFPLLSSRKVFKVFLMSDAISLFTSSASVLMFLGILTSCHAAKNLVISLPTTRIIVALSFLFISIATMMIASCCNIVIIKGHLFCIIPITLLAGFVVTLFVWLQFPLLVTIFHSKYGIFDKKTKKWL